MPAAQSFIQILGTFLPKLFDYLVTYFSSFKEVSVFFKHAKPLEILDLISKI